MQLDIFNDSEAYLIQERPWAQHSPFRDWEPVVGGFCRAVQCVAKRYQGENEYCNMETMRLLTKLSPRVWLAEIRMGVLHHWGQWPKDGDLYELPLENMEPEYYSDRRIYPNGLPSVEEVLRSHGIPVWDSFGSLGTKRVDSGTLPTKKRKWYQWFKPDDAVS